MYKNFVRGCALAALVTLTGTAGAAVLHEESVDGDLSNDQTKPTALVLASGSNDLIGTTGITLDGTDRDFATLVVPTGHRLDAMVLLAGTLPAGGVSFVALQQGSMLTTGATAPNPAVLLGWMHYATADIGNNLLPEIGSTFGSVGFSGPLPAARRQLRAVGPGHRIRGGHVRLSLRSLCRAGTGDLGFDGRGGRAARRRGAQAQGLRIAGFGWRDGAWPSHHPCIGQRRLGVTYGMP